MPHAVIIDAIRTPIGRRGGGLRNWHPVDLASEALRAVAQRSGLDPALIDEVIVGCATQVGEQAVNIARSAILAAGWPESVPGTTVDRQCGSSQQAIHFGAHGIIAGAYDVVVVAGVELMSRVPLGASFAEGRFGLPFGPSVGARYAAEGGLVPQGIAAELIAQKWKLGRDELDLYALESHRRAGRAADDGLFHGEILPVAGADGRLLTADERTSDTSLELLSTMPPSFVEFGKGGVITAGNSSPIADGAAALVLMSETKAAQLGLRPRARLVGFAVAGTDQRLQLTAPIPATRKALERSSLAVDDLDAIEINEAFASAVLAWERELHPDMDRVNPNGGAIALGHPLGCSGARLLTSLLHQLERSGGRYGLQTMCESGGMANATIIERL